MGGQGGSAGSGAGPVTRGEDEDDEGDISLTCTSQSDSWHSAPRCSVSLLAAPDCHNGPQWRGAYIGRAVLDAASHRFGEHMAVGRLLADVGTCPGKWPRRVPPLLGFVRVAKCAVVEESRRVGKGRAQAAYLRPQCGA